MDPIHRVVITVVLIGALCAGTFTLFDYTFGIGMFSKAPTAQTKK